MKIFWKWVHVMPHYPCTLLCNKSNERRRIILPHFACILVRLFWMYNKTMIGFSLCMISRIIMQITLTSVCNIIVYWLVGVVTPTQDLWRLIGGILYFNSFDIDIIITKAPFRSCARDLAGTARLTMHHGSVLGDANKKPISQKQSCDTLSTSLFPGL